MQVPATACAWGDCAGGSHGQLRATSPVGPHTAEVHVASRNCARRAEGLAGSSGLERNQRAADTTTQAGICPGDV